MRRKSTGRSATTSKPSNIQSSMFNLFTIAIMGGVLILGIGIGIAFSSTTTLAPSNVASREFIDTKAPNPEICVQYGASAMVMDARLFVTLNPFNVYVSQPSMRPGCVIRQNNWAILEQRRLVTSDQVRDCKNRLNTFGFTGNLDSDNPDIRCIYQNEAAQNFFTAQPGAVGTPQETDRF
ncbi:hypothetical protein NIES25_28560 [Nostoc linckia NIES-25]|jgi:hypothetical protein|uniref:DUF3172 domain-containing protein n=1 Tax=Nostoc sp. DSM 114161 TaxID=3440143 RepID=UPI000B5F4BFE|nr:hypothetical protein A6S26_16285 [Nostoc sp. ATCC 43529]BAY76407.1 hypothetical protein NIES25_28560 [Nostoc linckia NIES-25]